ncbi:flavin-containing monooxygenase [uncultured Ilumatobacter sp.]|uniref:flavin-containing monooxygenase n=1 Tax=uncultured Ilumatobacter sp. TaxID=879968 RepID=UPI00374ECAFD
MSSQVDATMTSATTDVDVVILGAGFSGLCAAIELQRRTDLTYVVLEKAHDLGGTWRDNTYPGVACDVPSHLYSFSFAPNPRWSKSYGNGAEIHAYMRDCAEQFGVREHIVCDARAESAVWDDGHWTVSTPDGRRFVGRHLIAGLGGLHTPNIPDLPGLDTFSGDWFHSARWNHDVELAGKRVAMVGTGATAVQSAPEIAKLADEFFVFQRSPIWCGPKNDRPYAAELQDRFEADPELLRQHRWGLWQSWETSGVDIMKSGTAANTAAMENARQNIVRSITDPDLAAKLTPDYNITCKRPTFSNDYYPMFNRPNVHLITEGIDEITPSGLRTAGHELALDVIVLATGFKAFNITNEIDIRGLDGISLDDAWSERVSSYRTVMAHGFPNLFMLLGPNSAGLTSSLQMIEAASTFAVDVIEDTEASDSVGVHPRTEEVNMFTDRVDRATSTTTANQGCNSWWTAGGVSHVLWPESSVTYRMMLRDIDTRHFETVGG